MASPIPFANTNEVIPPTESQHTARIVEIVRQTLQIHFQKSGEANRDVHAKSIGRAHGEFRVMAGLPEVLSQGLFANPGTYQAAVRFSNAAPWRQADAVPDARGLALQLADVPGDKLNPQITTQDFIMVNHSAFIAADVAAFLQIQETRLRARDEPLRLAGAFAAQSWNSLHWFSREAVAIASVAAQPPSHPASYTYYSMGPFRYGDYVAKYRILPATNLDSSTLNSAAHLATERDAMRHLLSASLQDHELTFDFQVQLRTNERSMPIEDASVTWPEEESPFQTVARLILPRQDQAASNEAMEIEHLSFDVWNSLAAHRPLGGINRLRQAVYPISAAFRHS
jgi:catalase